MEFPFTKPMALHVPRILGRYEIVAGLGHGGMATVYLGRLAGEAGFHRLFAIKVLHPHLVDEPGFVDMLLDEAHIAARLHHPNVVPIVDLGAQDGFHYVVMEYIEGCTLHGLLAKHRHERPPRLVVPLLLDALSGLHAAHMMSDDEGNPMNLVHRDVSPQNILVGVEGSARITDFGVARAESRVYSTRPGQLKGKIAYMSPEQLRAGTLDCRSDIFSVGVMLWSELTGQKLFLGATDIETMQNVLQLPIQRPSRVGLRPPAVFDSICLRALERDPDLRFQTAEDMEEALREAATVNGLLGTRREIAEWVAVAIGSELSARRNAIRAALNKEDAPRDLSSPSGYRMMPAVGTDLEGKTPSSLSGPAAKAAESHVPARVTQIRPMVIGRTALGALLVIAFATWLALLSDDGPSALPVAPARVAIGISAAPAPLANAAEPTTAPTAAAPRRAISLPEPSTDTATSWAAPASAPDPTPARAARRTRGRSERATSPEPTKQVPASRSSASDRASRAAAWDTDSPLPPP